MPSHTGLIIADCELNVARNDALLLVLLQVAKILVEGMHRFLSMRAFAELPASSRISATTYSMTPVR